MSVCRVIFSSWQHGGEQLSIELFIIIIIIKYMFYKDGQ